MLTFRKTLAVAAGILTLIYLFQTTTSNNGTPEEMGVVNTHPKTTDSAARSQPTRAYPPSRGYASRNGQQQPMGAQGRTLKERLRYQFPYEPEGKFPAYIWQTWKYTPSSSNFDEDLRAGEASWTELHPTFIHEVITDQTAVHLIRYLYASVPEVYEAYNAMPIPVLKADFFRYLILLARGGIYSDIDTTALKSAIDWIPADVPPSSVGLIVGIEADPDREDWKDWYSRRIQFCQWTIQAKPGHPVLRNIVAAITEDTLRMKKAGILKKKRMDKSIVEFTGPAIWTDTIFSYMNDKDYFKVEQSARNITWEAFTGIEKPKKVGDVVVLPITGFSPGVGQMGAGELDDPQAFVKHDFEGTWKAAWEHVKPIIENGI